MTSPNSTQPTELSQLNISSEFLQKRNFLERQGTKALSCDIPHDFFRPRWASPLVQPSLVVGWPFYNSKSSKRNKLASPFERKNKKTFSTFELLSELHILLVQWPDLVLAVALVRTPAPPVKMSLLALLQLKGVALSQLLPLCHVPLFLFWLSPLSSLYSWITNYFNNS